MTPQGYGSFEGDDPGATGSGEQRVTINAFKVIKVELEEDESKEAPKITIAMMIAAILTLITQMLFTKCKKRYISEGTTRTEVEEVRDEESEDDFEIISNHEEDQEVIREQDVQEEVEEERLAEVVREEPDRPPPQEVVHEGRKICVTKTGQKYHLNQRCETLRGYRSYEKKACERCIENTQRVLTIDPNRSPPQSETELIFMYGHGNYHHKDCEVVRNIRRKGKKPICYPCKSEERMFLWNQATMQRGTGNI